jgi:hypothetical protein
MPTIDELEDLIRRTRAAVENASDAGRPFLLAQADTLQAERDERVTGYAISQLAGEAEVIDGAAFLGAGTETP